MTKLRQQPKQLFTIINYEKNYCFSAGPFNGFAVLAQTRKNKRLEIYKSSLTNSKCYTWLDLSNKIGSRLSGSAGAEKRFYIQIRDPWLDRVYLQEVMVPKWVRGEKRNCLHTR
jgi:hypothetical protein